MLAKQRIQQFQELIFDWFALNQRDLPWRKTHDPYAVMVSEVMLQQTQVDRVKTYWSTWLTRWPTFQALAAASTADVIRAWAGLGYNRRAVNLQRAAQHILASGGFDQFSNLTKLLEIPGIGPGTAGAVMNFVWNVDTPFLEVNLKRIFQRLGYGPETRVGWRSDRELLAIADAVLPLGTARIWPHALMDFGALACRPNDPYCESCPLGTILPASRLVGKNQPSVLPVRTRPRFETTNRYWRGQILAILRRNLTDLSAQQLYAELPQTTVLEYGRFIKLVQDLERDRLLIRRGDQILLPE